MGKFMIFFLFVIIPSLTAQTQSVTKASCQTLTDLFGPGSKLSKEEKDKVWKKEYRGKIFDGQLMVEELKKNLRGPGFIVEFKCPEKKSGPRTLGVLYPEEATGFVVSLRKGRVLRVKGKLLDHSTAFGIAVEAQNFP